MEKVLDGQQGSYQVVEEIGSGGFGVTYLGRRVSDGARVAIKKLRVDRMEDWKALELFEREAHVLSTLEHARIPVYVDYFPIQTADGVDGLVLVQAYVDGESLDEFVGTAKSLSSEQMTTWFRDVLAVCDYLHNRKPPVIHRDIAPKNIILGPETKRAYLIDFGTVQAKMRSQASIGSTAAGTFGYAPPEQMVGRAVPASDLYALGVTFLSLASGKRPEELPYRDGRFSVEAILDRDIYGDYWIDAIEKMTEPSAEERLQTATEVFEFLAVDGRDVPSQQTGSPPARRLYMGLALLVIAGGLLWVFLSADGGNSQSPRVVTAHSDGQPSQSNEPTSPEPQVAEPSGWTQCRLLVSGVVEQTRQDGTSERSMRTFDLRFGEAPEDVAMESARVLAVGDGESIHFLSFEPQVYLPDAVGGGLSEDGGATAPAMRIFDAEGGRLAEWHWNHKETSWLTESPSEAYRLGRPDGSAYYNNLMRANHLTVDVSSVLNSRMGIDIGIDRAESVAAQEYLGLYATVALKGVRPQTLIDEHGAPACSLQWTINDLWGELRPNGQLAWHPGCRGDANRPISEESARYGVSSTGEGFIAPAGSGCPQIAFADKGLTAHSGDSGETVEVELEPQLVRVVGANWISPRASVDLGSGPAARMPEFDNREVQDKLVDEMMLRTPDEPMAQTGSPMRRLASCRAGLVMAARLEHIYRPSSFQSRRDRASQLVEDLYLCVVSSLRQAGHLTEATEVIDAVLEGGRLLPNGTTEAAFQAELLGELARVALGRDARRIAAAIRAYQDAARLDADADAGGLAEALMQKHDGQSWFEPVANGEAPDTDWWTESPRWSVVQMMRNADQSRWQLFTVRDGELSGFFRDPVIQRPRSSVLAVSGDGRYALSRTTSGESSLQLWNSQNSSKPHLVLSRDSIPELAQSETFSLESVEFSGHPDGGRGVRLHFQDSKTGTLAVRWAKVLN